MVVNEMSLIVGSVLAGIAGGFLSSWMAFNASGADFDRRKHGNALIVGALSGMALGLAAASTAAAKDLDPPQAAILLFTTFLASAGIDRLRSSGSQMIHRNATSGKLEITKNKEKSAPAPAPAPTSEHTTAQEPPK